MALKLRLHFADTPAMPIAEDKAKTPQTGFTLVELMVVVAVVGVLASVALPRYRYFLVRARQAEAKVNLGAVYTLQRAYFDEKEMFGGGPTGGLLTSANIADYGSGGQCNLDNEIHFVLESCATTRYAYGILYANNLEFAAFAEELSGAGSDRRVYPGCTKGQDLWIINEKRALTTIFQGVDRNVLLYCP